MHSSDLRRLEPFEEVTGTFRAYCIEEDFVIIVLQELTVRIPNTGLRLLESADLKPGDFVSILRTDNELTPIKVRHLR